MLPLLSEDLMDPNVKYQYSAANKTTYIIAFAFFVVCLSMSFYAIVEDINATQLPEVVFESAFHSAGVLLLITICFANFGICYATWSLVSEDRTAKRKIVILVAIVGVGTTVSSAINGSAVSNSSLPNDEIEATIMYNKDMTKAMDKMQRNIQCCLINDFIDLNNVQLFSYKHDVNSERIRYNQTPVSCLKEIEMAELALQNPGMVVNSSRFKSVTYYGNSGEDLVVYNPNDEVHFENLIHNIGCMLLVDELKKSVSCRMFTISGLMCFITLIVYVMMKKLVRYRIDGKYKKLQQDPVNQINFS